MADAQLSCAWTPRVLFEAFTPLHFQSASFNRGHEVRETNPWRHRAQVPKEAMSHDNQNIRLAARRSECNTFTQTSEQSAARPPTTEAWVSLAAIR